MILSNSLLVIETVWGLDSSRPRNCLKSNNITQHPKHWIIKNIFLVVNIGIVLTISHPADCLLPVLLLLFAQISSNR